MSRHVFLREIAHARAGDKGNVSNISLFVYDPAHYEAVKAQITPEALKAHFGRLFQGQISRYDLPQWHGFNFVIEAGLEGGVNRSLNLDAHGKSWSFLLLSLKVEL